MPSPRDRHRVLYVGDNYALLAALQDGLAELGRLIVRCPASGAPEARTFIESNIRYDVFLFDSVLFGATGAALARFALSLEHRADTPAPS